MQIISRNAADASRFYMSKPCKHGHSGKRYKSGGNCVECSAIRHTSPRIRAAKLAYRRQPATKAYRLEQHRVIKYDLYPVEFNFMLAGQEYRCAICRADEPSGRGAWHVDHCHTTGKVRGLLCTRCNFALGYAKDNIRTLANMIEYVNHHAELHLLDSGLGRDRRDAGADPDLASAWLTN